MANGGGGLSGLRGVFLSRGSWGHLAREVFAGPTAAVVQHRTVAPPDLFSLGDVIDTLNLLFVPRCVPLTCSLFHLDCFGCVCCCGGVGVVDAQDDRGAFPEGGDGLLAAA